MKEKIKQFDFKIPLILDIEVRILTDPNKYIKVVNKVNSKSKKLTMIDLYCEGMSSYRYDNENRKEKFFIYIGKRDEETILHEVVHVIDKLFENENFEDYELKALMISKLFLKIRKKILNY